MSIFIPRNTFILGSLPERQDFFFLMKDNRKYILLFKKLNKGMSSSRRWGISKQTLREKPFLISQMWGKETLPSKDTKFFILINIEEKKESISK